MKYPEARRPSPWRTFGIGVLVAVLVGCTALVILGVAIAMSKPTFGTNK